MVTTESAILLTSLRPELLGTPNHPWLQWAIIGTGTLTLCQALYRPVMINTLVFKQSFCLSSPSIYEIYLFINILIIYFVSLLLIAATAKRLLVAGSPERASPSLLAVRLGTSTNL